MSALQFDRLPDALEGHFQLLQVVGGTLTAQAYKAIDTQSNRTVTVWKTRGPLVTGEVARFQARLSRLAGAQGTQPILRAGVDSRNVGFAVLPEFDGRRVASRAKNNEELAARYDACVAIVETLHERSIVCGDLCLDSFMVNDRGKVSLFSVLGDVRLASEDEEHNRARYLGFRPPEQEQGGEQPASCDLYALGWIGEGVFASEVTEQKEDRAPPTWLKEILQFTATEESRAKAGSVKTIRSIMGSQQKEGGSASSDTFALVELPVKEDREPADTMDAPQAEAPHEGSRHTHHDGFKRPKSSGNTLHGVVTEGLSDAVDGVAGIFQISSKVVLLLAANFAALTVLFFSYVDVRLTSARDEVTDGVQPDTVAAIRESLWNLYVSDAPAGHQELIQTLGSTHTPDGRAEVIRFVIFRSRRIGLPRSAEVVRGSFNASANPGTFGTQDPSARILRVIDPSLSQAGRVEELTKLYDTDPGLATVLSAALALDSGEADLYRGILARAVADQVGVATGGEHSPYALMLLLPDVHDLFSEDLVEISHKIPAADIEWLLQELGRKGRAEISTVAQLASNRNIVGGPYAVFLKELQRSVALSEGLRMSLVSGTLGKLSDTDIRRFSDWYGQASPRVLEASIVTTRDPVVRRSAFEALRTKPQADIYVAKVMEFVDSSYGGDSSKYGGVVAVLALRGVVDKQTTDTELGALQGAPRMKEFLKRLVKGAPPEILVILLRRFSSSMDPLDIIDMLSNPSVEVRTTAVAQLSDVNDIMLMKLIIQSYDEEADPAVRAVYQDKIRVIRDRSNPAL